MQINKKIMDNPVEVDRRGRRKSVARTVTYGLSTMVVVLILLSVLSFVGFLSLNESLHALSDKSIPRLIQGSQFTTLSQQLVYETERLAKVESGPERRIAYKDTKEKLEQFEKNLRLGGSSTVGKLQQDLIVLKSTLVELNQLVAERIKVSEQMERKVDALFQYEEKLMKFDREYREDLSGRVPGLHFFSWVAQALKIINHTSNLNAFNTLYKVKIAEKTIRKDYFQLEKISEDFPEELRAQAGLLEAKLGYILIGKRGLLPLMGEYIKVSRRSAGRGNFTRSLVLEFESANTTLFNNVIAKMSEKTVSLADAVKTMIWLFFFLILSASFAVIWVIIYFRRNLTIRLLALNDAINGKLSGKEIEIDVQGNDEISEMAQSFSFYAEEMVKRERELTTLATQDPLTGVDNRRNFLQKGEKELLRAERYGYPVAFLMIDIDHFKTINDTLGHYAGDVVLENVANICTNTLRDVDIFGRMGGEEFAVVLPETDLERGLITAERLRAAVENALWSIDGQMVSCTISLGIAQAGEAANLNLGDLMKKADIALYLAKEGGRNKCVCSPE